MNRRERYSIVERGQALNCQKLTNMLTKDGQALLPILSLILSGQNALDEVIDVMGVATIQALLEAAACERAGAPHRDGQKRAWVNDGVAYREDGEVFQDRVFLGYLGWSIDFGFFDWHRRVLSV